LKADSAIHIGGPGHTLPLVDRSVEVDEMGLPFIPASSFRGRVRAHLERLLKAFGKPVCTPPRPDLMCPHNPAVTQKGERFCLACRIFGSAWRLSPVIFSDLELVEDYGLLEKGPWVRTGASIDRRLGTAEEQRLFAIEAVPPQVKDTALVFQGVIEGQLSREDLGWLVASLRMVTHLGGGKARGLGRVQVEIEEVQTWDKDKKVWKKADWQALVKEALGDGSRSD